jgi:hypothetical protein
MPKKTILVILLTLVVITLAISAGCSSSKGPVQSSQTQATTVTTPSVIITIPDENTIRLHFLSLKKAPLNETETADIIYLQEAEKVQRDIYLFFTQRFQTIPLFNQMAQAANRSMSVDNVILERYGIPNPELQAWGTFTNKKLQVIYDKVTGEGSSPVNALKASATSEDLHIADLNAALGRTDNDDLKFIYNQQLVLSRNNLRGIIPWIAAFEPSYTYSPTYITPNYYTSIITSPMETITIT